MTETLRGALKVHLKNCCPSPLWKWASNCFKRKSKDDLTADVQIRGDKISMRLEKEGRNRWDWMQSKSNYEGITSPERVHLHTTQPDDWRLREAWTGIDGRCSIEPVVRLNPKREGWENRLGVWHVKSGLDWWRSSEPFSQISMLIWWSSYHRFITWNS